MDDYEFGYKFITKLKKKTFYSFLNGNYYPKINVSINVFNWRKHLKKNTLFLNKM